MVAYTLTPGDVERGTEEKTVVLVQSKSSVNWFWKVFGALFFMGLCLGAVFVVKWTWNGKVDAMEQPGQKHAQTEIAAADKSDPHSTLRKISSKAKAAIHLEGTIEEDVQSQLKWHSEQGQAFAQGGIKLSNNQIIIPENGLYFVYSQASFRVSCSNPQNTSPTSEENITIKHRTPLSHRIWRFSESIGSETSLMGAVRSACSQADYYGPEAGQGWYNAIYLGAVFQLNKGDRLWTETNQLSELETEEGKTFFGVFALF